MRRTCISFNDDPWRRYKRFFSVIRFLCDDHAHRLCWKRRVIKEKNHVDGTARPQAPSIESKRQLNGMSVFNESRNITDRRTRTSCRTPHEPHRATRYVRDIDCFQNGRIDRPCPTRGGGKYNNFRWKDNKSVPTQIKPGVTQPATVQRDITEQRGDRQHHEANPESHAILKQGFHNGKARLKSQAKNSANGAEIEKERTCFPEG